MTFISKQFRPLLITYFPKFIKNLKSFSLLYINYQLHPSIPPSIGFGLNKKREKRQRKGKADKMRARKIILKNYFDGKPTLNNFELVEESIPETLEDRGMSFVS